MAKQVPIQLIPPVKAEFVKSASRTSECPEISVPEFAFIGRSNVGKSSLINCLANNSGLAKISGRPGKTQLINHFTMDAGLWSLVDLPGYGYAKVSKVQREIFARMIKHYLKNRKNLVNVFVLIDGRLEPQKNDLDFIRDLGNWGIPFSLVFTKLDKLSSSAFGKNQAAFKRKMLEEWEDTPPIFLTSAETAMGRVELIQSIRKLTDDLSPLLLKEINNAKLILD
ncbi:MAG: putative GTP-binding protein EngB [Owenweeksia sp. TMED14]|nr:MAG: putative GTP-binding protein EngB [Owenweeksia sp. TMED14]